MGNKVIKGTATGAIALAAFGVASGATVQAEELTKPSTSLSSDVTAPKAHNIKVLDGVLLTKDGAAVTTTPTERTVEDARGIKEQADQAVTDQAGKVADASAKEADSQKAVEDATAKVAEAEKNKAAATPDAIAQAEKGVTDTQKAIAQNQKASDTAANATQKATDSATTQKQAVEQAQKGVEAGQKAVDTAKKGVDTAKAALDGTGEQKALDEQKAANKGLEDAKKAESDAAQKLADAKKADADRHTQIEDLNNQAATQSKTATDTATDAAAKKAADNTAKADVNTAKKAVETAQAALDGTGAQKVLDEQKAAQKALSDAKIKEVEAAQKLADAKKADADRDTKIKNLTAKETEQTAAKTDAENALSEAKKNAEAKKATKEAAEAKRDALQKELADKKALSTINVPQYVIDAYKKYLNSDREEADKDALQEVFNKWIAEGAYDIERNGNVPIDPSTVDPAHMTREQAKALTQYYAHLLTAVRRQFWGTKVKTYTTEEAMDYVQKVAEAYAKENKPWSSGHSHAALAAGETPSSKLTWMNENISGMRTGTTTMTEMYRFIAGSIIGMMVDDYHSDFGHMSNMLGNEQDDDAVGVASSVTPNGLGRMHYVGFSDKYAGQALPDPYDTTQLEKDLAQAESDFQAALTAFNEANGVLTAKQAAFDAAHQALSTTQSELA
ncbi:MAG TPA: peptidase, partial [Streptococcus sp.]|nr:peptidase [Streptococcus sp.]